ncbi:MAG: glucose-6-phosphate isomerase [Actinomycetota bacterium]
MLKVSLKNLSQDAANRELPQLIADKVASRIFAKDFTLWGKDAEAESSIRLGWIDAAANSLPFLSEVTELREYFNTQGVNRVVLCGMGGSSLAPEILTAYAKVPLITLDSTDPSQVRDALDGDLTKTVVVVSSKSGSTVETDSQKRAFEKAFDDAGINRTDRIVIVTDPGSAMEQKAIEDGYRVFLADPTVGGRYSALTAFGVVPSTLAGVDMRPILEEAIASVELLSSDEQNNPALRLGAAMARTASSSGFRDKLGLVPEGSQIPGFGDWLEQLIAESTGKNDRGVLPVALESDAPEASANHSDVVLLGLASDADSSKFDVAVSGGIGEQLMLWEAATAIASRLLSINPFDQPDVESAKIAARSLLESPAQSSSSLFEIDGVKVSASNLAITESSSIEEALEALITSSDSESYFSLQVYLNRNSFQAALKLRRLLAKKSGRPVTFGWGPRFLHSTGQYHKGGPKQGIFLQLTQSGSVDQAIPGRDFSFQELIVSQADGDARVLAATGRPVLSLRTDNPAALIERIARAFS